MKMSKEFLNLPSALAESHIITLTETFKKENPPIPKGYSVQEDVNMNAPSLFTDTFMLSYLHVMTLLGLTGYAGAVSTSSRTDQIKYFIQCNKEAMELYERTANVMLNKGLYSKPPRINTPTEVDVVNNQSYLTG
ncbi:DUF3231 family protein [Metabacillus schmidteae]|uniref:DUF3231 family protein n=1 Tax=Metabacillus schmidteae TaxID=2730405 RepID=UPI002E27BA36|nr:DUF3231 family protein [Metabacillus schmidteae]